MVSYNETVYNDRDLSSQLVMIMWGPSLVDQANLLLLLYRTPYHALSSC